MAVHRNLFWKGWLANRLVKTAFRLTRDDDGLLVKSSGGRIQRRMLTKDSQWDIMDAYVKEILALLEPADPDIGQVKEAVNRMVSWYSRQPGNAAEDLAEITQGAAPTYAGYDHHGQPKNSLRASLAHLKQLAREAGDRQLTGEEINAVLTGLRRGMGTNYTERMAEREAEAKNTGTVLDVTSDAKQIADAKEVARQLSEHYGIRKGWA